MASAVDLADWLEIYALRSADRNSSIQDLARAINRDGTVEDRASDVRRAKYDELALASAESAFEEVEDRSRACGGEYPFAVHDDYIQLRASGEASPYMFLLLLSTTFHERGVKREAAVRVKMFEEICADAGRSYFGGADASSRVFGFPRRTGNRNFSEALDAFCVDFGEGAGHKGRPTLADKKDAALDVIVWRTFPDRRAGKLIAFGQCATGRNWRSKLTELQPDAFWDTWIRERPAHPPLRLFFTPYRLDEGSWFEDSRKAGLFFDRCRIVAHLQRRNAPAHKAATEWVRSARKALSQ
jgi:hypothetical protein